MIVLHWLFMTIFQNPVFRLLEIISNIVYRITKVTLWRPEGTSVNWDFSRSESSALPLQWWPLMCLVPRANPKNVFMLHMYIKLLGISLKSCKAGSHELPAICGSFTQQRLRMRFRPENILVKSSAFTIYILKIYSIWLSSMFSLPTVLGCKYNWSVTSGLNPWPQDHHANALPTEPSQHSVASLNLHGLYKSCSIDPRNDQSPKCEVVHETKLTLKIF